MPHCILEYSDNLADTPDLRELLDRVHAALMASGQFALANLKSRAYEARDFTVADGDPRRGFVALAIHIFDGRSDEVKVGLAESVLPLLQEAYPHSIAGGLVDLSVRIVDIHRASYRKLGMADV